LALARNEQLIRQHKILQVLERRRFGATLDDLRDTVVSELGLGSLHERSIRRDLEALQAAGMGIATEETQSGKVWKLSRADKGLHKLSISASELIALSMGRDLLLPLVGTQFWHGIEAFWNKVREQLPSGVWEHYQRYRRTLRVLGIPAKTYEKQQGILKTINRCIQEHRRLEIEYQSLGKPLSKRKLEPYGLVMYQSSIYVIAPECGRDEELEPQDRLRHWKLDRFEKADAMDEWFKPDADVDLDEHLGQSIGIFSGDKATLYSIRLSSYAARWIKEDPWHPQQTIEPTGDGWFLLKVPAFHSQEIISRVMALGAEAEVVGPASCRKAIAKLIADLHGRYEA
jgi:predicted DNA-binding transcriptional regulator YafY